MPREAQQGPMAVVSEESQRVAGDDARSMNLAAARAVAESVRTTLGPRGMDKMLINDSGEVIVTNDGVTLLAEMDVDHPAAQAVVEVAATQEVAVGDGTTSAVILVGELVAEAEELLEDGLHPTTIVGGYQEAADVAQETLARLATAVHPSDTETLERIARTAMTGKGAEAAQEQLAAAVVQAVRRAVDDNGMVDENRLVVRSFSTGSIEDSRFIPGYLFDFNPCHEGMPRSQTDADVLVYDGAIEVGESDVEPDATVGDFDEYETFVERDERDLDEQIQRVLDLGADIVLTDGDIQERARERFVEEGITAYYQNQDDEMLQVARATGATVVNDLRATTPEHLGYVGNAHDEKIRTPTFKYMAPPERTVVFEDLPAGDYGTVLLRGGTEHVLEEVERAVEDSVGVVSAAIQDGVIIPGGGAPQMEIARAVRDAAAGVEGREQLAVEAFADAAEAVPRLLARNAGHDPIDTMVELRSRHDAGEATVGVDADTGEAVDAFAAGVVEPILVQSTAVDSALDAVTTVLRIDDIIAAGDLRASTDDEDEGQV